MLYQLFARNDTCGGGGGGGGVKFELKGTRLFLLTVNSGVGKTYLYIYIYTYIYTHAYAQDYVSFPMSLICCLSVGCRPLS